MTFCDDNWFIWNFEEHKTLYLEIWRFRYFSNIFDLDIYYYLVNIRPIYLLKLWSVVAAAGDLAVLRADLHRARVAVHGAAEPDTLSTANQGRVPHGVKSWSI